MNIYVISNPNDNRNLVKVGQTNDWKQREKSYKNAGFVPKVFHLEYDVNFTDDDIKTVLTKILGYQIERKHGDEWYVVPEGKTEAQFANEVKAVIVSLKNNTPLDLLRTEDFPMRKEQSDCVDKTIEAFKQYDKFLWNCKMRFGKTFTTYQLCKKAGFKNVLILTWKVAVEKSWEQDLLSHIDFRGMNFINKTNLQNFDPKNTNIVFISIPLLLANKELSSDDSDTESNTKITDNELKGFSKKLATVANIDWDMLVIDEAHYGTRAENTRKILGYIKYKKLLELSGTPFKIIEDSEYTPYQIYNWTYQNEQNAKKANKPLGDRNPYKDLPDMKIYTYDGAWELVEGNTSYDFNINKIFETNNGCFLHPEPVSRIINFLCGDAFDLNEDKDIKDYDVVLPYFNGMIEKNKKSLWFLPTVDSVCALEKMLKNHRFFKDYHIINATGKGEGSSEKSLEKFLQLEKNGINKIICLSCGMLNTGVTIKPLNSVIMLQDKHSAQDFFQSIFRCQSPAKNKPECYVFDFNPKRYFENLITFAKTNNKKRGEKEAIEENLIETHLYLDGKMKQTTYEDIMSYVTLDFSPDKIKKAFLKSNNIKLELLEQADADILSIIDKIPLYKNEAKEKKEPKSGKSTPSPKKKEPKEPDPTVPKRKNETQFDIRKAKLDVLISSLTIFIYITNAQEQNLQDIINTKERELFSKLCFITVDQFNKLYENQFFKNELLNKAIYKFKNEEYVSRNWDDILKEEFIG